MQPNAAAFNCLIKLFAGREDAAGAYKVLSEMAEAGLQPDLVTINSLMDLYVKVGLMDQAKELLEYYGLMAE